MSLIKLGLGTMPIPDKIQFGRQIVQAMTDNPDFPAPSPGLLALSEFVLELEDAYNNAQAARQTAKMKTSIQDERAAELDGALSQLSF